MRILLILAGLLAASGCDSGARETPCTRACAPNMVYYSDTGNGVCWCDMRYRVVHIEPNSN